MLLRATVPTSVPFRKAVPVARRMVQARVLPTPTLFSGLPLGCGQNDIAAPQNGLGHTMMRHGNRVKHLGRPADQRKALIRSLVTEVLRHGQIRTTKVKAKVIRSYVEHMITLAKRGTLHSRRQAEAFVFDKELVGNVFKQAPERYKERAGGYTRIKTEPILRRGDATEMAVIELV